MLHPEFKLSSSKKQLQRTCKTFPTGAPVLSSVQMEERCWICLARLTGLGLPFPEGDSGYETCSQSRPCLQALCPSVLLVSGLQSGLELGTEVCEAHCTPIFRVLCKNLGEALLFWCEMAHLQKTTPVKMQWSGMPGLFLKCHFLIKGSGIICLDRPDCTTA